ncbi:exodeoxyribonuclease I [Motiliproteus sediminis]|uniref:exodeoxyribonuclease I n=1 Tax=Motiliproteus sediminis TaxID=1468178 RepID=UPI001AEFAF6A|nr:exodeoxyribonuclease I [Motiliproteus sediminis]
MANSTPTFYWHDYETFGATPSLDRPCQFAGIRTDWELNPIGDPLMIYCKPADDYLPHPEACLITGITPQTALKEGVCEAEFMARIHAELAQPGTCGVGYNSLRFDDEVTRYGFYRNFIDPYGREWQNGNSRWDVIDMLRMARALRPEGIEWPRYEDGTPSLRLEDLTRANGLSHEAAHDALSDVYATIAVARLVKERQPRLFEYALKLRDKRFAASQLDVARMKPVLHISSRYSAEVSNTALVVPLAAHLTNRNAVIVYDLRVDPTPLLTQAAELVREKLYTASRDLAEGEERIPLKLVHLNRTPMLAPATMLTTEEAARLQISGEQCRRHLGLLRAAEGLTEKLQLIYSDLGFESGGDPDLMLYSGGFFSPADRAAMDRVRATDPSLLGEETFAFQDGRLEEMLFRYRARNYPATLSAEEQQQWEQYRQQRLLEQPPKGALTFEAFYSRLNQLAAQQPAAEKMHLLEELAAYGESIYPV